MVAEAEAALLARCRRGEEEAWNELFDLHYGAAARFIFQLGHDFTWEDAAEICQETFLSAIKNLECFNGQSHFQTWLFRIAANKARDFRERQHAIKRGSGRKPLSLNIEPDQEGWIPDPAGKEPSPDQVLVREESMELLHKALAELGEPCREILELRYFGDLSYEELSATLELNVKTVSSRLSKCLDKLQELGRKLFPGEKWTMQNYP